MTAPDGSSPDGSLGVGLFAARQAQDEADARAEMTSAPINSWGIAQDAWKAACQVPRATLADLKDGQNALKHRLDLLDEVSGYGSAVMAYNWQIPYSQWVVLPFDTQLGPMKSTQVSTAGPETGFLTLKKGGLWRVDTHFTVEGMSMGVTFFWNGSILTPVYNWNPIFPTLMIEVVDSQGGIVTARQYNLVSDLAIYASGLSWQNNPRSGAFSHTFVLDDMPDEDDPEAEEHWKHVRLAIRYEPIYSGTISETDCKVYGGTKYSSLIATRWSRDAVNLNYAPTVPDGGDLG